MLSILKIISILVTGVCSLFYISSNNYINRFEPKITWKKEKFMSFALILGGVSIITMYLNNNIEQFEKYMNFYILMLIPVGLMAFNLAGYSKKTDGIYFSKKFDISNNIKRREWITWIISNIHIPVLIPPFDFNNIGGVIPLTQGFKINEKAKLNSFKGRIEELFNIKNGIDVNTWERKRDRAVERINKLIESNNSKGEIDNDTKS